mmetsp:Transcript_58774/g.149145  ORF Transcript_58774/g.149145 Transcript_58774/m.149145 type:complete len:250 (+) Transcript_58774:121-870(+)
MSSLLRTFPHREHAPHTLIVPDVPGDAAVEEERHLLPARRRRPGPGAEGHGLVADVKADLEPAEQGVDLALPLAHALERCSHVEAVGHRALAQIQVENAGCGRQQLSWREGVDHRLGLRRGAHDRVVEAPNLRVVVEVPINILCILHERHIKLGAVGKHQASGLQPAIPGLEHLSEPGLVHEEVAHPLAHNDVNLLEAVRQLLQGARRAAHKLQHVRPDTVLSRDLLPHHDELVLRLQCDDFLGARLYR